MKNNSIFPLQFGSTGKAVQMVQNAVGISPFGIFNKPTLSAVKTVLGVDQISTATFISIYAGISLNDQNNNFPLQGFSNGNKYVRDVQIMLEVPVTGNYDSITENAVMRSIGKDFLTYHNYIRFICSTFGIDPSFQNIGNLSIN